MSQHMLQWQLKLFEEYRALSSEDTEQYTKRKIRKKEKKMNKNALKERVKREQEIKQRNYLNTLKTLTLDRSKKQIDNQRKLLELLRNSKDKQRDRATKEDTEQGDESTEQMDDEEDDFAELYASTMADQSEDDVLIMEREAHEREYN